MALIGEMQYLTIGGNTYSIPTSGGSTVTVTRSLTSGTKTATISVDGTSYDLYAPTPNAGTITSVKTTAGAHTAINVSSGAANFNVPTKTSHLTNDSGFVSTDTKNTAGVTRNTSDKLYLVGAPYSADAYAQTYTNTNIYYQNGLKSYATYGDEKEARVLSYIDTSNSNTPISTLYACNSTIESYVQIKPDLLKLTSVGSNSNTKMELTDESFAVYDDDGNALIEMDSWDGDLYLRGVVTPTSNYHAANKLYVDNAVNDRVPTSRTVNGKALSSNISLTASDVGALPSSTVIPTVNNATLTIQKNGTTVNSFTANASSNVTANITVPTKTSELTNDSGYITNAGVTGVKGNSESSYRTGQVNLTAANIGATSTSVLPNDNGEIKTKFRISQKGYTGSGTPTWYYPLVKLPADNSSNYASLIVSGRIGGWTNDNMSSIQALIWNRGNTGIALLDIAGGATAMSSIWGICDIVVYTESDTTDIVYLMVKSYYTFDLDIEVYQSAATILYDGTYLTTTPTGTLNAQASTSTKRVEIVNGKLLVNGTDLSIVAGTGLSKSGTTLNHSNSVTAQTTQAVYPIKIDAQGHISAYGSAQTILSIGTTSSTAAAGNHTHDIGLGSTTDTTSGVTLASATKYKLTAGGKSVYFTMPTIPTVSYPVTSVNNKTGAVSLTASDVGALASGTTYVSTVTTTAGTHTAISSKSGAVSFNVPTKTSHLTNDSGFITSYTDEKVKVSASSSSTIYYPILATTTGTATRQIDSSFGGLTYISIPGTTSTIGTATLQLGNETASGTANNENGILRMCGTTTKYHSLQAVSGYPAANRSVYFPRYANNMYLTCTSNTSAVGGATTKPVYVDDTGCIQAVTSIPYSLLTGAPTSMTPTSHTHGNITNGGDITATAPTIASGDQIIINDNSASKITNGPTFDGSTTTKALSQKGTWETFSNSLLYGECSTAAATAAKEVTVDSSFKLVTGATVAVKFTNANSVAAPTLNVNDTGAVGIVRYASTSAGTTAYTSWTAGETVPLVYNGSKWAIMNNIAQDNMVIQNHSTSNTSYNIALSGYTSSSGGTGTLNHSIKIKGNASTGRIITSDLSDDDIDTFVSLLNYSQINAVDYVVEEGTSGSWHYRKWNSGIGECWLPSYNPGTYTCGTARSSLYSGANLTLTFPITFISTPTVTGNVSLGTDAYVVWLQFNGLGTTTAQVRIVGSASIAANNSYLISVYAIGEWK